MTTKSEQMKAIDQSKVVSSKKIANNTCQWIDTEGTKHIILHETEILTIFKNGSVIFNTGGWSTRTTKDRMNEFQNVAKIYQEKSIWYFGNGILFQDGMKVSKFGNVIKTGKKNKNIKGYLGLGQGIQLRV